MKQHLKGLRGEEAAAGYLKERGYCVLARNFRSRRGEVDLIARKGEELVFIEVKSWDVYGADSLEYAINALKQRRIRQAGMFFVHRHPDLAGMSMRFDVLLIRPGGIDHIENAFDGVAEPW